MSITNDIRSVNPGSLITLYELDTSELDAANAIKTGIPFTGISNYYFHNGVNQYGRDVVWQGKVYTKLPVEATGFEMTTKGTLPKPTLRISNLFMAMTSLIQQKGDLVGAKLIRRRTMHRYLDSVNFASAAVLDWKTTGSLITTSVDKLTATLTGVNSSYHNICSSSGMSSSINNGATYYWETTINTNISGNIVLGITTGNTSNNVLAAYGSAGRGYYSFDGKKWYSSVGYTYDGSFTTGDVIGIVYDSALGNLYFYKNGISCELELDGVTPKPAFTSTSAIGTINPSLVWNATVSLNNANGTVVTNINFGATPFTYGIPNNIPNRPSADIITLYGNSQADPNAHFSDDLFFVNRKSLENHKIVEYELSTALDVQMVKLPRRQIIQNTCLWRYRGDGCNYTGTNYYDVNNNIVIDPDPGDPDHTQALSLDICAKKLSSCKLRFPNRMPFGGFPGAVVR